MHFKLLAPIAAIVLTACAGAAGHGNGPAEPPPPDECGARELGRYLGMLPTAEVKAAIAARVGERPIRYIAPGDAVTMDYRISRLNVETGEDGRIKRFRCG